MSISVEMELSSISNAMMEIISMEMAAPLLASKSQGTSVSAKTFNNPVYACQCGTFPSVTFMLKETSAQMRVLSCLF